MIIVVLRRGESVDDLISRRQALDVTWKEPSYTDVLNVLTEVRDRIKTLPSARSKIGTWRHYEGTLTCSECTASFDDSSMDFCGDDVPHFCPDCGAEMKGVIE